MARRGRKSSKRRGIIGGGNASLLKNVMVGMGTAAVVNKIIGQQIPYQDALVSGAAAKFIGKSNMTGALLAAAAPVALKYVPTVGMSGSTGAQFF